MTEMEVPKTIYLDQAHGTCNNDVSHAMHDHNYAAFHDGYDNESDNEYDNECVDVDIEDTNTDTIVIEIIHTDNQEEFE